jgi:hypothetical protein
LRGEGGLTSDLIVQENLRKFSYEIFPKHTVKHTILLRKKKKMRSTSDASPVFCVYIGLNSKLNLLYDQVNNCVHISDSGTAKI